MKANVGGVDRALRIVLGLGLLSMFFLAEGTLKYVGLVGIIPLLTGLVRFCPLYSLIGASTCPRGTRGA
ncbi:MAG: DUF2892 domain-containing protein [Betaproteobacteria bacterium]|nr:DUF2892 domain-containing protein [Betaproteobacteria bacterium]